MRLPIISLLLVTTSVVSSSAPAAELVLLTDATWDEYAPRGKEVDCIYGDYVLRNDKLVAVVANPVAGRHVNLTIRDAGGALIDLTLRGQPNDQLSGYFPAARQIAWRYAGYRAGNVDVQVSRVRDQVRIDADQVELRCRNEPAEGQPKVELSYRLEGGWDYVLIETTYENATDRPLEIELVDSVRADRTFERVANGRTDLFWCYDEWFDQAYGVVAGEGPDGGPQGPGLPIDFSSDGNVLRFPPTGAESAKVTLQPGEKHTLSRRIFPGRNLLDLRSTAAELAGEMHTPVSIAVVDERGEPVADARVTIVPAGSTDPYGRGRTAADGSLATTLPAGRYAATVAALGRDEATIEFDPRTRQANVVTLNDPGWVVAEITDDAGRPIPSKTQFRGRNGAVDPFFGPDSGVYGVQNLYYSHDGRYRQALPPGKYDVIVSYGPEYDAFYGEIDVARGQETPLRAVLVHSVQTPGWISADFHSHSSPSGDNTTSQLGRVLNLLCEHLEFAPCTEHNRVSSYSEHLKRLAAEHRMATCSGIELTGSVLPVNHQNAFPLVENPRTQNGGGPDIDADPELQIERLALWDDGAEKLVQENHPDLGWVFFDRDEDGQPDKGFEKMSGYMDAIEVHPPHFIFEAPLIVSGGKQYNNTIFNWLQLLNQGYRLPGVVNTDAHYTFHGSGFLRNYLKCPTDDPAQIATLDMVHAAERGNVIMTNGPFMEVFLAADEPGEGNEKPGGTAGDDVIAPGGKATLQVRVQCSNWLDVDRVQVFLNGLPDESLNFTRAADPSQFPSTVVRFERTIPLTLLADTHVIVAAIGENGTLGPVMGPNYGQGKPIAVSNPIFVDLAGDGFQANGDTLGAPLPVKEGRAAE